MRWSFSVIVLLILTLIFAPFANAIVFLPAIVLIPIAKIVALIIGGFSFPALGLGTLWGKLSGKSLKKTIPIIIFILLFFAIALALILKIHNPERPLF